MRTFLIAFLMLSAVGLAQNSSPIIADPPNSSTIRDVPASNISRSVDSLDYDNPGGNPDNLPPAPVCSPDQIDVKLGTDNAANGQHGIPVSFTNNSNDACTLGPAVELRLENSSRSMARVRENNVWVTKEVTRYQPIAIRACQNCGMSNFGAGPGQDIHLDPNTVVYEIIGFTSLNAVPCATADTLTWSTAPGAQAQHIRHNFSVCQPLRFSGVMKRLPEGFTVP